jgi:hypothetical protein
MSSGAYRTAAPTRIHGTPRLSHRHRRRVFTERQRRSAAWYSSSSGTLPKSWIGWSLGLLAAVIVTRDPSLRWTTMNYVSLRALVCQEFVLVSPGIKKILLVIQWDLSVIRIRPFPSIATGQPIRRSIINSWGTWTAIGRRSNILSFPIRRTPSRHLTIGETR